MTADGVPDTDTFDPSLSPSPPSCNSSFPELPTISACVVAPVDDWNLTLPLVSAPSANVVVPARKCVVPPSATIDMVVALTSGADPVLS